MKNRVDVLLLVSACAVLFASSAVYSSLSERALRFDPSDGTYYLSFYAKAFDPSAQHLINPEGRNVFFFSGTDGAESLHQDIHFEPIKYVLAAFRYAFATPMAVIIVLALLAFSPLLYGAYIAAQSQAWRRADTWILIAYATYPSVFISIGSSLRPIVLLPAFFMLAFLAICYARPLFERFALFALLFLAREEALILGAALFLIALGVPKPAGGRFSRGYLVIGVIGALAFIAAMILSGYYVTVTPEKVARYVPLPLFALVACSLLGILAWLFIRFRTRLMPYLPLVASTGVALFALAVIMAHLVVDGRLLPLPWSDVVRDNYTSIAVAGLTALAFLVRDYGVGERSLIRGACAVIALSITAQLFIPGFALDLARRAADDEGDAALVFRAHDAHPDRVLASYATITAWHEAERSYAFERFPARLVPGPARFYPENANVVRAYLKDEAEAVVIGRDVAPLAEAIARSAGKELVLVEENARYAWYTVR